jgi:RNA polymerase primary sigma factor
MKGKNFALPGRKNSQIEHRMPKDERIGNAGNTGQASDKDDLVSKFDGSAKPLSEATPSNGNRKDRVSVYYSLNKYFNELQSIPLLTADEEQELGRTIKNGQEDIFRLILDFNNGQLRVEKLKAMIIFAQTSEFNRFGKFDRIMDLIRKATRNYGESSSVNGGIKKTLADIGSLIAGIDKAKKKMVEANLRLVVNIAKRYRSCGLEMDDLIQEGNKGLIMASTRYDYETGYRFATYASYWIHQAIQRAIANDASIIHVSVRINDRSRRFARIESELSKRLSRKPELYEIALEGGWSKEQTELLAELRSRTVSSLTGHINDEGDLISGFTPDTQTTDPSDALSVKVMSALFDKILGSLPKVEREVLIGRFRDEKTLLEISRNYNVSKEWIRQLESKALRTLRYMIKQKYPELLEYVV